MNAEPPVSAAARPTVQACYTCVDVQTWYNRSRSGLSIGELVCKRNSSEKEYTAKILNI